RRYFVWTWIWRAAEPYRHIVGDCRCVDKVYNECGTVVRIDTGDILFVQCVPLCHVCIVNTDTENYRETLRLGTRQSQHSVQTYGGRSNIDIRHHVVIGDRDLHGREVRW